MDTIKIFLIMMFFFAVTAPVAYCEYKTFENPVHEQRKANEKKKEVYGPKTTVNSENPVPDQTAAENKNKDEGKGKNREETTDKKGKPSSASGKNKTQAAPAKERIPPPSKELQALKKKRDAAKKRAASAQAPKAPDVAGTVMPTVPKSAKDPSAKGY